MQPNLAHLSHRVEQVFDAALSKQTGAERDAFLDGACGSDVELRARVDSLLAAHQEAGSFLLAVTDITSPMEGPGETIGHYKILQKIGEGGFGAVYLAEQQYPIRRKVALKIIKLGMDTKQVIARFEAERQALALMDHPHIAKVLDAGATESGRPYFIMELVRGIPITDYCDRNKLPTGSRLELFVDVCRAVQHAHNRGIIHRDIKPNNVLVTLHDGRPVPKIIDFGIAKATNQRLTEKTLFTEYQQFIGTPQYMSPEQAEMGGLDIDTRSDIYSLGALLYELMTGAPPFDSQTLRDAGYAEVHRIIREIDPDKPSTRAATLVQQDTDVAKFHGDEPQSFARSLRGDLDWIVTKAMEKDRTRRYDTANELLADIQRHLRSEAVLAGPPAMGYKLQKFVKRNRIILAAGGLVIAALFVGTVLATAGFLKARQERDLARSAERRATQAAARSQAIADFLQDVLTASDPQQAIDLDVDAQSVLTKAREVFGADHATVATTLSSLALQLQSTGRYDRAEPLFRQAIQIWEHNFEHDHVNKGVVLSRLGTLLRLKGDESEAERAFQDAIRILSAPSQLGDEGVVVADALTGLAEVYQNQGKYEEAEQSLRQSLEIRKRRAPHQHLQIALTYNLLASVLSMTDQTEKVREILDDFVDAFKVALPPDSNAIAKVTLHAGHFYLEHDELDKAEAYLKDALRVYQRRDDPSIMNRDLALRVFSTLIDRLDDGTDAFVPRRLEFLRVVREVAGEKHPKLGEFLAKGAAYCVTHGRLGKAIELAEESLDKLQACYDSEIPTKQALVALTAAGTRMALDPHRSENDYRAALHGVARCLEIQPDDGDALRARGMLLYRLGRFDDAIQALQQCGFDQNHKPYETKVANVAFLAMAQCRAGHTDAAAQSLRRLQDLQQQPEFAVTDEYTQLLAEAADVLDGSSHPPSAETRDPSIKREVVP